MGDGWNVGCQMTRDENRMVCLECGIQPLGTRTRVALVGSVSAMCVGRGEHEIASANNEQNKAREEKR